MIFDRSLDGSPDYLRQAGDDARLQVRMGDCMYDGGPPMSLHAGFRARRLKPCRTEKHQSER
jgi:hypothetical protein